MYSIPVAVDVNGHTYNIRNSGDFRVVLDCFAALQDDEISEEARILASLIMFYEEFSDIEDLPDDDTVRILTEEMFKFFNCGELKSPGFDARTPLIDWEADSQLICAAVNNVAKTEVRAIPNMHWWTFVGYYMSVGESVLSTVVGIRDKIVRGKNLEKWERDFRKHNPEYFMWRRQSVEDAEFERQLREQFHKKDGNST